MILSKLKTYGIVLAGGALSVLLIIVKILTKQNSKLRVRVQGAEASNKHAREVLNQDITISDQTDSHRSDLINELEDTNDSTAFRDPDKLWNDTDT